VWSIALSGGYEDDFDEGYRFVYTGSGGRKFNVNPISLSPPSVDLLMVVPEGTSQGPGLEYE
jgi:hypothetical protein